MRKMQLLGPGWGPQCRAWTQRAAGHTALRWRRVVRGHGLAIALRVGLGFGLTLVPLAAAMANLPVAPSEAKAAPMAYAMVVASPEAPLPQMQSMGVHRPGKFIFMELSTPDVALSKRFYGGLFSWTFRDATLAGELYAEASLNGQVVAGLVQRAPPVGQRRRPAWLAFCSVADVDAVVQAAQQQGAQLLSASHRLLQGGRAAVLRDPQGAVFAVLSASGDDPADVLPEPGEWIWNALISSQLEQGAAFYQQLIGYEVFDLPPTPGAEHLVLASQSYARASANSLPPGGPSVHSHWLGYVRVQDIDASLKSAQALGGHVLLPARSDRHGGRLAVVEDPAGAAFGLMEWPISAASPADSEAP